MKDIWSVYFILVLMIFCPVLDISGHFINLVELYVYLLLILNIKKLVPFNVVKIFWVYIALFSLAVVFTALLASKPINNYDLFIIRNAFQFTGLMSVLYFKILKIYQEDKEHFNHFIFRCFCILSLPALIVILQRLNIFNMRAIVIALYKPQFFFLSADLFSDFRYTSVFKDFFTAGVYFIVLSTGLYYFYLNGQLSRNIKIKVFFILIFIYISQVFVARSSLVLIPFNLLLMTFVASKSSFLVSIKRLVSLLIITIPIFGLIIYYLNTNQYINVEWVSEGLNLMAMNSEDNGSSFTVMQDWNKNFFDYLSDHPELLFIPNHDYDLKVTTTPSLYTDGFYPQEIYRYGIYGLLAYAYLVVFLLKELVKKNRGLMVIIFSFVLLNYKGGNVFFMPKNVYLYAFLFAAFLIMDEFADYRSINKELV
jgi:hypothetical protein